MSADWDIEIGPAEIIENDDPLVSDAIVEEGLRRRTDSSVRLQTAVSVGLIVFSLAAPLTILAQKRRR